ncbi:DEAD/DEAH box helicase family protein [Mesorhizobium sp. M8A.F.Ca.ET.165.01.1.1]|uniref:DEAD/DEAH box helicase n=1 Tax=Mesorhizobium sp. M8A.F.Ca.ET.165.01.1.1 TaxID=2563960 RepID=UPI0010940FF4|nr:DEAD/DEAH box helicase family protein [Mesorhizobium sp. M8A.F.Ca.ET.165.01.1.1]TGT44425.1 DEAD/DEAH box helicase [Mesorhizobium sp. M8A.F.Ca.ET.165.01.1.1]
MDDLFAIKCVCKVPERLAVFGHIGGNRILQVAHQARQDVVTLHQGQAIRGRTFWRAVSPELGSIAVVDYDTVSLLGCDAVLKIPDISSSATVTQALEAGTGVWIGPKPRKPGQGPSERDAVTASWKDRFDLISEEYEGDRRTRLGLRPPQVGAIHAVKAHWSVSTQPATLVLPTGAGKTDTMAALLVSEQIPRLLVIVPSDPLRRQIGLKFAQLDVLKAAGLVPSDLRHPAVAILSRGLKSIQQIDELVAEANVVVTTMSLLTSMSEELRAYLAASMSHLFVDEAHHIGANTWRDFKALFHGKTTLQFTATPFRNDGRRLDGKFIYVYPLRRAQKDKLFTSIAYVPVHGHGESDTDRQIAARVKKQLLEDEAKGYKHLAMARTGSVNHAIALHEVYRTIAPEAAPTLIHSEMSSLQRAAALTELRSGRSRIIVCVDMLGEGFDLPDLKIAGLHDKHKSESVTLQFIGRFTRARQDLGTATVIANIQAGNTASSLNALFAEDADWNHILAVIGHNRTERERRREDLFGGFPDAAIETFPLETIEPRFSTVIYRTTCAEWDPTAVEQSSGPWSTIVEPPAINAESRLVLFVRRDEERLRWTSVKAARNVSYNLVMAHWDPDLALLFIHGSDLADLHAELAKALAGDSVQRITGEQVFRVLYGFRRLMLTSLGLSETQRKPVRYSQFMGSDIADQLDTLPGNRSRTKTNLFGLGYVDVQDLDENGSVVGIHPAKETIGCSQKGKFWSYQSSNSFSEWIDWCHDIGRKVLNDNITPETILRNVVRPRRLATLPSAKIAIGVAWPETFLDAAEDRIDLIIEGQPVPLYNCEIELDEFAITDVIKFRVSSGELSSHFELQIGASGALFRQKAGQDVQVVRGRARKEKPLVELFHEDPPHIYFADGDTLVAPDILELSKDTEFQAFDPEQILPKDWSGVDIRAESQGPTKRTDTVQGRVVEMLRNSDIPYDIIFDDDGAGEVADVVAIRRSGRTLIIDLFHCKYSSGRLPGARVEDLYEVCGQAQKSVRWAERFAKLLDHLRRRELDRNSAGKPTRFERGSLASLMTFISQSHELHAEFSVTLVQPGYSRAKVVPAHLELFAATASYLMETWRIPLQIFASA